jgi:hypothetical protein
MTELNFSYRVTVPLQTFEAGKTWSCLVFIGDQGAPRWCISVRCFRGKAITMGRALPWGKDFSPKKKDTRL